MTPSAKYIFIRHGEHPTRSNEGVQYLGGLTERGVDEARQIGERLNFDPTCPIRGFTVENERSITTVALALRPNIDNEAVERLARQYVKSGRIALDSRIDYKRAPDDFIKSLNDAFLAREGLKFLVRSTRDDKWSDGRSISTYGDMARTLARRISVASEGHESQLICAREFFYPSLRARLIEQEHGITARDDYVEWYGEKVEWKNEARTQIQTVQVSELNNNGSLLIEDAYGTSEYPTAILRKL